MLSAGSNEYYKKCKSVLYAFILGLIFSADFYYMILVI